MRKTNVEGTGSTIPEFESNLKMFVSETKAAGGVPVLFTPVVRCNFSGNKISETGRHITADGDYAAAVREVAAETGTPVRRSYRVDKSFSGRIWRDESPFGIICLRR